MFSTFQWMPPLAHLTCWFTVCHIALTNLWSTSLLLVHLFLRSHLTYEQCLALKTSLIMNLFSSGFWKLTAFWSLQCGHEGLGDSSLDKALTMQVWQPVLGSQNLWKAECSSLSAILALLHHAKAQCPGACESWPCVSRGDQWETLSNKVEDTDQHVRLSSDIHAVALVHWSTQACTYAW